MGKLAKYQIVYEEILTRISNGEYKTGEKIPPESQLMEFFSVSRHTIRQAISALVNDGVLEKVQGSGTFVLELERKQRSHAKNKTIGVITTYLSDYIFPSIIRGIEEELRSNGYSLLLASTQNNPEHERESLEMMMQHEVEGLIVEPTQSSYLTPNLPYYLDLKLNHIPFVYLHSSYPEMDAPMVGMDDVAATEEATEHLLKLGHRQIAIVTKVDDVQGRNRLKGFMNAFEKAQLPLSADAVITYETISHDRLHEDIAKTLTRQNRPTAFVAYNDQTALLIEEVAQAVNLRVPEDLSLVSHDASGIRLEASGKMLTSILHPQEQMGKDAANLLLQLVKNSQTKAESIIYKPSLIIKDSTKSPLI